MTEIIENYDVKNESTFKIGSVVKKAAFPATCKELTDLISSCEYDYVLGNCSNVLFSSNKINKSIIFTKNINDWSINNEKVKVSAGTIGSIVSKECEKRNLTGFEFLIGFPGSFGGMIYMNASAHNQAISDNIVSVKAYDIANKTIKTFYKDEMEFSYRHSKFSNGGYIILEAEFELTGGNPDKIQDTMRRNIEFRKLRQPSLKYGNAGSIFKNPENDSAGRLLDLCGMKGVRENGAMVFENHANFIINYENATSDDVINLMYKMYSKVKEKYTIELHPEIKYIGDEGTKEYETWKLMTTENTQTIKK